MMPHTRTAKEETSALLIEFQADFFDGISSATHPVIVKLEENRMLYVLGDDIDKNYPVHELTLYPPVGTAKAVVIMPDGSELHITDLDKFHRFSKETHPLSIEHLTRFLERHLAYAFAALLFSATFIFFGIRYGMPTLATSIANHLPYNIEQKMRDESLQIIDKFMVDPSKLSTNRQHQITTKLQVICKQQHCPNYRLHFRSGEKIGPNAFALPAGDIIVMDQLVNLAKYDEEILAVLFHELGHVKYRHSIRLAIQSTGAAALLVVVTGDISSISDTAAGLPSLLMQNGYQRDMEREADVHSLQMLKAACIAPRHFANIMKSITAEYGAKEEKGNHFTSLLASHPDTISRIKAFQSDTACQ